MPKLLDTIHRLIVSSANPTKQQTQEDSNDGDPINENIQTIVELHKRAENEVSRQQRTIEDITDFLGRPTFLFIILAFVSLWIIVNTLLIKFGFPASTLHFSYGYRAYLHLVRCYRQQYLITQNRENVVTERRTQLDLQVSLIIDQKMSNSLPVVIN